MPYRAPPTSHPHPEGPEAPQEAPRGHAHAHPHHEAHLDPVEAAGLAAAHGPLRYRHLQGGAAGGSWQWPGWLSGRWQAE